MMKKILTGASVLAVLAAFPAFAADTKAEAEAKVEATGTKVERGLEKAGETIEKKTEQAGAAVKEKYSEVKAYFTDDDDVKVMSSVNVMNRLTADEVIGAKVMDPQGKDIGSVQDILVDAEGDAERVIINDGGVLGLGGKLVSFDYDIIEGVNTDADVVVKLSEASVKEAKAFDDKAIPAELYSVKEITGSKVVDAQGKAVATVDTVAFEDDDADYLIVTFNRILGMGGERAALDFDALDLSNNKGKYTFKLNSQQTAQFENYKEAPKAN
jgi:sporulation protein YlmC with PRC-barrel domain